MQTGPKPSIGEIQLAADIFQRIADRRRIEEVNRRDDRQDLIRMYVTLFIIIAFLLMWQ